MKASRVCFSNQFLKGKCSSRHYKIDFVVVVLHLNVKYCLGLTLMTDNQQPVNITATLRLLGQSTPKWVA